MTFVCEDGGHTGQVFGILPDTGHVQPEVHLQPHPWQGQVLLQQQGTGKFLAEEKVPKPNEEGREKKDQPSSGESH